MTGFLYVQQGVTIIRPVAFYMSPDETGYFAEIIRNMPKDLLDVHIGPLQTRIDSFDSLSDEYRLQIRTLLNDGYSVLPLNPDKINEYRVIVSTSMFYGPLGSLFDWSKAPDARLVALYHTTFLPVETTGLAAHYYILSSRRELEGEEDGKILRCDKPELYAKIMTLKRKMVNEYAFTGLFHLGEWTEKRKRPKRELRKELEECLGSSLDPAKPVVAFLEGWFFKPELMKKALARLAPHVNLIVKGLSRLAIEGAHSWPKQGFAPNLLRFASDYILAGYRSGTLTSSTMLGLKVIPCYTSLVSLNWHLRSKWGNYKAFMPGFYPKEDICVDIIKTLNPPLDLENTSAILQRMHNKKWWEEYSEKLPQCQKNIFDDYMIDGAAQKTAHYIIKILTKGSLEEDAEAVRLRPEYM